MVRRGVLRRLHRSSRAQRSHFRHLLAGVTVSAFGSQMTGLVLPLMAVQVLAASPQQMALLQAAATAPYLLFGLFAGHWLEGRSLRQAMITADLARALLILAVAAAVAFGTRNIYFLIGAGFVCAAFGLMFDTAYYSFVPRLVEREGMLRANSRIETGRQSASVFGAAAAGLIFQTLGPPLALCMDGGTYLLSALSLSRIPADDVAPRAERTRLRESLARGFSTVAASRLLISLTALGGAWNFFFSAFTALYVLFLSRALLLSAAWISIVIAAQSLGLVVGAWAAPRLIDKVKLGLCIGGGYLIAGGACLVVGLVGGGWRAPLLAVCAFIAAAASMQSNIAQLSMRQSAVPRAQLLAVNATVRFVFWGMLSLGALAGGAIAVRLGLRQAVIIAALGLMATAGCYLLAPVGRVRELPNSPSKT
jgi:MFS family permease